MIKNIESRKITDAVQSKLQEDIKVIKQSKSIFISADKSTNIYAMEKEYCNQYFRENITKTYQKKTDRKKVKSINYEAQKFLEKLSIDDRVKKMQENEAFITIKDYKEGFPYQALCISLHPSKNQYWKNQRIVVK